MSDKATEIHMADGEELGQPDAERLRKRAAEVRTKQEKEDAEQAEVVRQLKTRNTPPGSQPPAVQ